MAATTASSATNGTGAGLIQSLGIGSGLDVQSLVTQLVAADRAPLEARLTRQASSIATSLSAMGSLKGAISGFQSALTPLTTTSQFQVMATSSADETVFTATASGGAVAGSYGVEVRQLAQPEQLISTAFAAGATTAMGTGTLQVSLGSASFGVTISADKATLGDVRDAINSASGNPGVKATLVYGIQGAQLVLTSGSTGAGNAIKVTATNAAGALAQLSYSGTGDTHYTEAQQPQDAIVMISGVEHHSASNVVTGAIDGVTLNLKSAKPNTVLNLGVTNDQGAVLANVNKLVEAYNSMQGQFKTLGGYNAATKTGGPLLGDWLLSSAQFEMNRGMTDSVSGLAGNYSSLAALGITTGADGSLSVDSVKLQAALSTDGDSVARLFSGPQGVATRLNATATKLLATGGAIAARDDNLATAQKAVTDQETVLNARMSVVQARYLKQFNALDSLMSSLQSTSNYLTQQLANTAKIVSGGN
jgi:flagellar hook-associated protein 2